MLWFRVKKYDAFIKEALMMCPRELKMTGGIVEASPRPKISLPRDGNGALVPHVLMTMVIKRRVRVSMRH